MLSIFGLRILRRHLWSGRSALPSISRWESQRVFGDEIFLLLIHYFHASLGQSPPKHCGFVRHVTFVELWDLLDKDNYARELLHSIVPRLNGIGHLDGKDFLFVEIVVDGLKRSEAVLRRLISRVIEHSQYPVILFHEGIQHLIRHLLNLVRSQLL